MPDTAHPGILDRTLFRAQIAASFRAQLDLLEQMVNYGTNLVPRCFESSEKGVADMVAIIGFLKHAVSSLDAIHILAMDGATLACLPQIRSIFEVDLYLRWIFADDYAKRATAYFVWNIRQKRYWLRCYLDGTPEFAANASHMKDAPGGAPQVPFTQEQIKAAIAVEEGKLNCPETIEVNRLFEKHVAKSGKEADWYVPTGPTSIRDIARRLGDEALYKVFYSQYSQATHGLSLDHQFHFVAGKMEFVYDHIRTVAFLDHVFQMAFTHAIHVYRRCLERYRKEELGAFRRKVSMEWGAWRSIPPVTKHGDSFNIGATLP